MTVGEGSKPNLLGRNWFSHFGLRIEGNYNLEEIAPEDPNHISTMQELLQLPTVTGDGTGCYRGPPLHLDLDPTVRPVNQRARRVPFALTAMNEAIDANVKGIWAPMRHAGPWESALVPVPKKNGTLRLCADYRGTVNPAFPANSYRTSTSEEIFARLSGGNVFADIDLEAYQQCRMDDETSRVLAVNTVKGLFPGGRGNAICATFFQARHPFERHFICAPFQLRDLPVARRSNRATSHLRDNPVARHLNCAISHLRDIPVARHPICATSLLRDNPYARLLFLMFFFPFS